MNRFLIIVVFCLHCACYGCKHKSHNEEQHKESKLKDRSSGNEFEFPLRSPGFLNDLEQLFSASQSETLDSILREYEKQTTNEIVIVTVDSMQTNRDDFEAYTLKLANYWSVGKKEKNNGILIGISKQFKMIRINNGYGIEKILSDAETKKIIDEIMIPQFKAGNYFEGTKKGIETLMQKLK